MGWRVMVVVLAAGCAGDGGSVSQDAQPLTVCDGVEARLGTGAQSYREVTDGELLYLYRGSQGGYHLNLAIRARGVTPSDVTVAYRLTLVDGGERFGEGEWRITLPIDVGGGWYERAGIQARVDAAYNSNVSALRDRDADVAVVVTDNVTGCQLGLGFRVHIDRPPM